MRYIKVLATDSTNTHLKRLLRTDPKLENTSLMAETQTQGRGQLGKTWETETGKSLTFSILLNELNLKANQQFKLSALVSMALVANLSQKINGQKLQVKWPNDILAGNQKVCGILIENTLQADKINHSVIGIGLNINQVNFDDLPQASSLKKLTGQTFDLDHFWTDLTEKIERDVYNGLNLPLETVLKNYEAGLFRLGETSTFVFPDGTQATGKIQGVLPSGRLQIGFAHELRDFEMKEVKLIY